VLSDAVSLVIWVPHVFVTHLYLRYTCGLQVQKAYNVYCLLCVVCVSNLIIFVSVSVIIILRRNFFILRCMCVSESDSEITSVSHSLSFCLVAVLMSYLDLTKLLIRQV
jgi:hypothetical protein